MMTGARHGLSAGLLALNRMLAMVMPTTTVRSTSALVFAPHPDDEVLGCGGILALKAQAGTRVKVVVMTDGRTSHSKHIDAGELVRIRRAEAEEAGRRLGISSRYEFLDFEDHRLSHHRESACSRVVELIREFEPEEIYVPHRRDLINDHVETNLIVRRAIAKVGRPVVLFEYPVWLWNVWPWTPNLHRHDRGILARVTGSFVDVITIVFACRVRCEIGSVAKLKSAALDAYRSQMERLNGDPRWSVLADVSSGEFLRCFEGHSELFHRTVYRP